MTKVNPVIKVKGFATAQSLKLSETTIAKKAQADNFLTTLADVMLFMIRIFRETFSRGFEFKEFFRQCYQIGYKSMPLISVKRTIIGLVLVGNSRWGMPACFFLHPIAGYHKTHFRPC